MISRACNPYNHLERWAKSALTGQQRGGLPPVFQRFSREVTGGLANSIRPRHSRHWCSKVAMHAEEDNPVKDMVLFQTPIGWVAISGYAVLPGPGSAVLQRQAGTPLAAYTCTTTRPAKKQTKHPDVPCGFFSGPWP